MPMSEELKELNKLTRRCYKIDYKLYGDGYSLKTTESMERKLENELFEKVGEMEKLFFSLSEKEQLQFLNKLKNSDTDIEYIFEIGKAKQAVKLIDWFDICECDEEDFKEEMELYHSGEIDDKPTLVFSKPKPVYDPNQFREPPNGCASMIMLFLLISASIIYKVI